MKEENLKPTAIPVVTLISRVVIWALEEETRLQDTLEEDSRAEGNMSAETAAAVEARLQAITECRELIESLIKTNRNGVHQPSITEKLESLFIEDKTKLKLTHIPQLGHSAEFCVYVNDIREACFVAQILWQYDLFQYHAAIKPDYANATLLDEWLEEEDEEEGWYTWYDEDGNDFSDYMKGEIT